MATIYLAGGCFWGTQAYLRAIPGVRATRVGYANSIVENPTYEQVCTGDTLAAETVEVTYDPTTIDLGDLLFLFFEVIDPTTIDRQGEDTGTQYRTGIYYTDRDDLPIILDALGDLQKRYAKPLHIEEMPLGTFFAAEDYHQDYLDKNPGGYCHIPRTSIANVARKAGLVKQIRELGPLAYQVTQHEHTEEPFANQYDGTFTPGIYVDIVTGQPLFSSRDKFDSGCGWPAFSKPMTDDLLDSRPDNTIPGRPRTEVRAAESDSHLGHVFTDGPVEQGGLRYCINSAALRFIPKDQMEQEGYGAYLDMV